MAPRPQVETTTKSGSASPMLVSSVGVSAEVIGMDDLNEPQANLVRRMRAEQRELQETIEAETVAIERSQRSIQDIALEHMHRGDSVRISVGRRAWTGEVIHVGTHLLSIRPATGTEVDVGYERLSTVRVVARAASGGGSSASSDPASLVARLRDLQRTGAMVEIGGVAIEPPVRGVVVAVARQHVELLGPDGTEWVLGLRAVDYVIRGGT